ncbi:helix-hairpin-helix domain-containing protein [candidate division KSB1 bacterium]|nr:helix-hairpin-helix domain-containing protein [candidate division KSB1 bacterium]MBL7093093.1 helix-hairpin-helix domain-containing protein [candidate division KSB1 bacterium]
MIDFLTKQEKIIFVFLISGLLIGSGIRLFYTKEEFKPNSQDELNLIKNHLIEKSKTIDSLLVDEKNNSQGKKQSAKTQKVNLKTGSVDINKAGFDELILLPGVGPVLADRIIEYRKTKGMFSSPEELLKVKGIGKKKLSSFIKYIYVAH